MSHILSAVAWPYTNGPRHIGHVAGFGVPSDVFSRYMRMAGHDVLMVSGTDEHGTPILVLAEQEGVTPQELTDRYNRVIVDDLANLGLSYDLFTRTTTRNHYAVVQEMFRTVHKNGYMVEQTTMGAISPSTGRTLPDRYIEGTCPICGYDGARGDQCDNCGNQLDAVDLINPRSRINGEKPTFIETQHFFLDLPALADALGAWLRTRTHWRPNVLNFSLNLLDDLRPRAMTRDIDWGIPVPLPGWEDNPAKRLYVWFDAVIGYLSASIEWARRQELAAGGAGTPDAEAWRAWWNPTPGLDQQSYYFMGKDNITFHSQIWPAELLGYAGKGSRGGEPGIYGELNLPTEVVSSEFLTTEGKQFSTSRGVVVYVRDMLARYQPDALRYFIAVAGPESSDSDFTWSEFKRRTNDELVAGWGNLVNRTATMVHKNFGAVPEPGERLAVDEAVLATTRAGFAQVGRLLETQRQRAAVTEAMRVVGEVNKYVSETEPWKLKTDRDRLATVLHTATQAVADCNVLLAPFLPHAAQEIHSALGGTGTLAPQPRVDEVTDLDDASRSYPIITGDYVRGETLAPWESAAVVAGTPIEKPSPVFTKLDDAIVEEELERMRAGAAERA
ncbi:methionyl-tRNA synthetase [Beutenbergia cavernae DSM 12333]|uniref:Methionine--tRNA ligase n=1 Tax=Beutenbergia cavernae (strain ATCC BAA-8 / DSM 12333 / CCUG 43141 / JCM 11478 / NBRC 16432 / NCIMB 13614 / HKI 0122) TaxID=471853 RepID=SYM_BEUC1|nr:methionine--tRNA ligase [Beutenbergia cavernae]C5C046.1 RecName: Full=Methionine--tRNA ligase; AltName: Full=Methionyl-tRNA synthetase; Short=MetRS [Beutenbergia cavernae DSM 12333]ACQ79232.1 methionyl-tRNA synthetase [Beutenbergia cavernae DSM 12333]